MPLKEERLQILKMLEDGKITADQAAKLLTALEAGAKKEAENSSSNVSPKKARWLRVRVIDHATGKQKINVTLPMGLVNVAMKMGAKFAPDIDNSTMNDILTAIDNGSQGKIADIEGEKDGERVEIFVE